jgi:hypothetical protein
MMFGGHRMHTGTLTVSLEEHMEIRRWQEISMLFTTEKFTERGHIVALK